MGLFKSFLESAGIDLNKVKDAINNVIEEQGIKIPTPTEKKPAYVPAEDVEAPDWTPEEWCNYFRGILQAEFPQYAVRENVPVTEIAGPAVDEFQLYKTRPRQVYRAEWGKPYTFVLYAGGAPKGVVMLGAGKSHAQNVKYLIARMYAKKCGLPYINFYTQMPNERDYVVSRIHRFLG